MFKWLEQYFTFTRGERNAIIALIVIILLVLIMPRGYLYFSPVKQVNNSEYLKQADVFSKQYKASEVTKEREAVDSGYRQAGKKSTSIQYFNFDPNKIGVEEWVKLGFTEKQALTIEHYKGKGARFYVPEDLKRLFVMTPEHYGALLPYVKINKDSLPPRTYRHND